MKINSLGVDDLPEERLVMESSLAELGQNIIVARSGEGALLREHAGRMAYPPAARRALQAGFRSHLVKPIDPQTRTDLLRRTTSLKRPGELSAALAR